MPLNQRRDQALATMMRASTQAMDGEPAIENSFDVCYANLAAAHDEVSVAATALVRAGSAPDDDFDVRSAIVHESWRSLIQLAVSVHLAIGHFPFLEDIEELFPGNEPGFHS